MSCDEEVLVYAFRSARVISVLSILFIVPATLPALSQDKSSRNEDAATKEEAIQSRPTKLATPEKVEVAPAASDTEIAGRLRRILNATEWFDGPTVNVDQGVVFLHGKTRKEEYREWATSLSSKTGDVVAVVNHIEVTEQPTWDLSPAWYEVRQMGRRTIQSLPLLVLALIILTVTWVVSIYASRFFNYITLKRMPSALLRQVMTTAVMIPVWIIGIYFVLRISGLTQMALTVLGGTGLAGLIIGIAFQNIAENFLASILISVQRPFQPNDFVDVAGYKGLIQRVTARGHNPDHCRRKSCSDPQCPNLQKRNPQLFGKSKFTPGLQHCRRARKFRLSCTGTGPQSSGGSSGRAEIARTNGSDRRVGPVHGQVASLCVDQRARKRWYEN
jgi:small conductance mechanosensitive channel